MKKTLILLFALGTTYLTQAQIQTGNVFVAGSVGFNSGSSKTTVGSNSADGPKSTSGNFSPSVGYFFTDNLAGGLRLNVGNTVNKSANGNNKTTASTFGVGLFGRSYKSINEKFYFFGELNVGIASGKTKFDDGTTKTDLSKNSAFNVGIAPGFTYFPSSRFGLDFSVGLLGFSSTTTTTNLDQANETENKNSDFDLNWNMTGINIGVQFFLK